MDLSQTTHVDAGNYTDPWTFTDITGNYNDASGTINDIIRKIDANCFIDGWSGDYDGLPHEATGYCTGLANVDLSDGLDLGASFTDAPGGTANWTFTGGTNYNDQSGSVAITINQIDAICTIEGWSGNYDALAHGATGPCTGLADAVLPGLDLGSSFTDVPGGTANWTFDGSPNYINQNGSVEIIIDKIDATCRVVGWSGIYDGLPHGGSGSCTGVGGVTLTGLNLGASFTDVDGGNIHWSFSNINYFDQSGNDDWVEIFKAPSRVTLTFRSFVG